MQHEEEDGEVDVKIQEYKKLCNEARRSPYPSLILEVKSMPAPDFDVHTSDKVDGDDGVTSEDVKKLEALFSMSAAKKPSSVDDPFYDALGEVRTW